MEWPIFYLTFCSGFPVVVWVLGQLYDSLNFKRRTVKPVDDSIDDSIYQKILNITGALTFTFAVIFVLFGGFNHSGFLYTGLLFYAISIICWYRSGLIKEILNIGRY
jgi:hypothetical protein